MTFEKRKAKHDWRAFLTLDEAPKIAALEREAGIIDTRRRELTQEMNVIRNRALQRALEVRRRKAKSKQGVLL